VWHNCFSPSWDTFQFPCKSSSLNTMYYRSACIQIVYRRSIKNILIVGSKFITVGNQHYVSVNVGWIFMCVLLPFGFKIIFAVIYIRLVLSFMVMLSLKIFITALSFYMLKFYNTLQCLAHNRHTKWTRYMLCDAWYLPSSYIEQVRVRTRVEKAHLVIELDLHIHLTSTVSL